MSGCLLAIKLLAFFGERIPFTIASIRWGAKTFRRWSPITYVFSVAFCFFPLVVTADNFSGSVYVYGGIESAAQLIHDSERGSDPSLSVAIERGHSDTDRHTRDGKLNLVRINGKPAMAYSLNYYGGIGYLPALVVTCRERGLLEFSQILWDSNEIDYEQYEPYLVEYQGYGLDDLFKLSAEVESVVDYRGTTVRFRGTIRTNDPGIGRLGATTNLQAYIRFSDLSFGTDNSDHANTLGALIDYCSGKAMGQPVTPVIAAQPSGGPDTLERIISRALGYGSPTEAEVLAALESRLALAEAQLDALGDGCKTFRQNNNPLEALGCLMTGGGALNSERFGIRILSLNLHRCMATEGETYLCRYTIRVTGNAHNNPMLEMLFFSSQSGGVTDAMFQKIGDNPWEILQIYDSCTYTDKGAHCRWTD